MPDTKGSVDLNPSDLSDDERAALQKLAEEHGTPPPASDEGEKIPVVALYSIIIGVDGRYGLVTGLPDNIEPMREPTPDEILGSLAAMSAQVTANMSGQITMQILQNNAMQAAEQAKANHLLEEITKKGGHLRGR